MARFYWTVGLVTGIGALGAQLVVWQFGQMTSVPLLLTGPMLAMNIVGAGVAGYWLTPLRPARARAVNQMTLYCVCLLAGLALTARLGCANGMAHGVVLLAVALVGAVVLGLVATAAYRVPARWRVVFALLAEILILAGAAPWRVLAAMR